MQRSKFRSAIPHLLHGDRVPSRGYMTYVCHGDRVPSRGRVHVYVTTLCLRVPDQDFVQDQGTDTRS